MKNTKNEPAAGTPLPLRCCSAGTPLVAGINSVSKHPAAWYSVGTPLDLRRCSAANSPKNEADYLSFG